MNRRTCTCGVDIVRADIYGYDIWLDNQPADDGMYSVIGGSDTPHIAVDLNGTYRRHTCTDDHEERPDTPSFTGNRADIHRAAAQRGIAAAHALADSGTTLQPREQQIAKLRLAHPDKSYRELAAAGLTRNTVASALHSITRKAQHLPHAA